VTAHRQEWDGGWWELEYAAPHERLRAHVVGSYVSWREGSVAPTVRREYAGAVVPLIFNFGPAYTLASPAHASHRAHSFTAGVYDTWVDVTGATHADALQVNLTPLAARRILGAPMTTFANTSLALDEVFGARGHALTERLGNADTLASRARLVDAFLLDRLDQSAPHSAAVTHVFSQLVASSGQQRIAQLQHDTGLSAAQLGRALRDACGLTPKRLASILRFEHAMALAQRSARRGHQRSWSEIAATCGYADHAHLTRDVQRFAGETPTAIARKFIQASAPITT
jgi:AraC-like DNA-binding protein